MLLLAVKLEHECIRSRKKKGECLSWEDYKKMEFTQKVKRQKLFPFFF